MTQAVSIETSKERASELRERESVALLQLDHSLIFQIRNMGVKLSADIKILTRNFVCIIIRSVNYVPNYTAWISRNENMLNSLITKLANVIIADDSQSVELTMSKIINDVFFVPRTNE